MARLFVGNLPYRLNEQDLMDAFADAGVQVSNVHLPLDKATGQRRGFGFIEVEDGAREQAKQLDGMLNILGRSIRVDDAAERPQRAAHPQRSAPARESESFDRSWEGDGKRGRRTRRGGGGGY